MDLGDKLLLSPFREVPGAPCDQPVFIQMPNIQTMFVAVFDSEDKLRQSMEECGVTDYKIKKVDDAEEFIESVCSQGCRIMFNPYRTDRGTTRWTELENDDLFKRFAEERQETYEYRRQTDAARKPLQ
jgi:hypothetical protein